MKKKIIGILVCMLVIATAIPSVTSIKDIANNTMVPNTFQTNTGDSWIETQKLLASDGTANDAFGTLALDGDTALIGASGYDGDRGSVYYFTRTGATWIQQQKFTASDGQTGDWFGIFISIDGNTALIGASLDDDNGVDSGSAYVFTRTGTTWTQQAKLLASDGAAGDMFGWPVSLSGDTALIGAYGDDGYKGSAYVFTRTGITWTQQAKLLASDGVADDYFGYAVSLDGDTAIINGDATNTKGSAYIFTRTGTTWTEQQKINASDGQAGDVFGVYVSIDGDTVLIGANHDDDNGVDSGSAYVFTRTGTTWTQQAKLLASDGQAGDRFGWPVDLDGDVALIGGWLDDDNGVNSGSAYVFTRTGTTWTQQAKLLASDGAAGDEFSVRFDLDGDTALIGACNDDDNGTDTGSAYVFTKVGLTFSIAGGLGVSLKITNTGTATAYDVPWWIHVEGGILGRINKTVNGTVDVPAGELITIVKTGFFFGFGPISIIAKVANEEQTAEGTQLIIFSIVKK